MYPQSNAFGWVIRKLELFLRPQTLLTQREKSPNKRQWQGGTGPKRQKTRKEKPIQEGSSQEVLLEDVRTMFQAQKLSNTTPTVLEETSSAVKPEGLDATNSEKVSAANNGAEPPTNVLPERFAEIEVKVQELSSTGDGLALQQGSDQIYVVPFTAPGDTVKVKVVQHFEKENYSLVDFISVVEPSPLRDDSRVNCKYFSKCSGCQFQMLDYHTQLQHKKTIVKKAFRNFSQLPPELVPPIEDTFGSPLQYSYRTKLTPHFDAPPGPRREKKSFTEVPPIGFMLKGRRTTLDIEDCPIATDAVRMGMKRERLRVAEQLHTYSKGVTILLRESTRREENDDPKAAEEPSETIKVTTPTHTDFKTCVTDPTTKGLSTEYIEAFVFTSIANSFFQNNNSILSPFTQYIRDNIIPPVAEGQPKIKYFIDAYSGSGLFTITLSALFEQSVGIDVSGPSIVSARENAKLNNLTPEQCKFIDADANELFKSVTFPKDETVVVLDPPRKGCDKSFLKQLLKFSPRRVVYVSCNVHTQARDVGVLVRGIEDGGTRYRIESLRGFDFFPQTSHVEGVAVLSRVEGVKQE
ncbi:putative tRNA (uracil-5-)-methyltransferase [Calycina marina]|uniref:tRNA (uracil(54)-C(5))-methyltransferase n=1 Tax=Calycina marina TaxID=1763456 RepID=A0A9P7Z7T6_9HELO|nr:putative tRNA (uracil-5-)-methyltransferase [Calycina marina]